MSAQAPAITTANGTPWIASRRWDMTWLTLSALFALETKAART